MVLLGKTDRLVYVWKFYGMEMSVEKTKAMRISRQPSPVQIVIGQKELDIVEYFKYFGSMIQNDVRCTSGIKFRIIMTKGELKEDFLQEQIGLQI
jgi:hypothetical protein